MARKQTDNKKTDKTKDRQAHSSDQGDEKLPVEQENGEPTRSRLTFRPRVDIYETESGLELLADMPGAAPDSVEVNIEGRELTIRATVDEEEPDDVSLLHREYQVGDFERRFQLAGDFDSDKIEAKLTDGLLRLTVPNAPEPEAKQIKVKAK